jgi:hypothetical protein
VSVTIGGTSYEVYGSLTGAGSASEYFNAALHGGDWIDADPEDQAKALVTATRMMDRQNWQGTKTSPTQFLDWPRTGVVDREGNAVSSSAVPDGIVWGTYELAEILRADPTAQEAVNSGSNVRAVGAGSARVEFFQPTRLTASRFGAVVDELVGEFLDSAAGDLGIVVTGAGVESSFSSGAYGFTGEGLP